MRRKHSVELALVVLTSGAVPRTSHAYVPPASSILASAASHRADIPFKNVVVEGRYRQGTSAPVPVWEAIVANEARRIELRGDAETKVLLSRGGKRWSFAMGQPAPPPEPVKLDAIMSFIVRLDSDSGGQRGLAFLAAAKIDSSVVSLARLERRVAYVIGALPWETTKPQLWIDKELLVPVRFVEVDPAEGTLDTRLLGFDSAITGRWYPERIEVWKNGVLQESLTYRSLRLNEELDPSLFKAPS